MRLMTKLRLSVDRLCLLIGLAPFASCASGFAQNPTPNSPATTPTELQTALHKVQQEIAVAGLLQSLHKAAPHGRIVFKNVHIIDPASGAVTSNQSVVVEHDRIVRVGDPSAASSQTSDTMVIDAHGRYLSPGLTDMHVHSSSAASWLLDLSNGVTGVRDMAGFPWLLKIRENVSAGRTLAPSLAVAGPLINAFALEGYAVAIRSPLEGRRTVRQQAACGYDFIKVWNVVSRPVFDAVAEQAHLEGMDLVGHVPQGIPIRHAAESGMRTMEHLKGFINDQTLKRGETDYSAAVSPNVWNTPTLYAGRDYARGAEAQGYLAASEMRYVSLRRRNAWIESLREPETPVGKLSAESRVLAKDIVRQLVAAHAHFLAGTDSESYAFQVSGFALIEELHLLQDAGLSAVDALRSATTEAASAMREPAEFGQVREGLRADLLLLDSNPLEDVVAFRQNRGVMARGFWLTRDKLDAALTTLAEVQSEADLDTLISETAVGVAAEQVESLTQQGFVFDSRILTGLASTLRAEGYETSAARFETLADIPRVGPCAEPRP